MGVSLKEKSAKNGGAASTMPPCFGGFIETALPGFIETTLPSEKEEK